MTDKVLTQTIRQAMRQCDQNISISWQGGEPTLLGLPFFEKAVELERAFGTGKVVGNALQTNGILLDRKWAKFFNEYRFLVGLSIDGPEHIHDHYRRFPNGKGTWGRVVANARMLLTEGVSVNAMTCLSDYSAKFPKEIYQFHRQLGLVFMQFIPIVEPSATSKDRVASFSVSGESYGDFLSKVFDIWLSDFVDGHPTTSVRHFESMFFSCLGDPVPQCTFRKQCGEYLVVEHNGDVYPCDFFVEPRWKLGNVMKDSLIDLLNSKKQAKFRSLKRKLPAKCKRCKYVRCCYGGCTKDRAFNPGEAQQNYFCQAYTRLFQRALPVLNKMASEWKHNNNQPT